MSGKRQKSEVLEKVERREDSLIRIDFSKDAGLGFETADRDAYLIPFLTILQTNSPQCSEGDSAYIRGAKPGDFYNTATREIYSGKEGVLVLPAAYQQKFVEWVPRNRGGGFRGEHSKESVVRANYPRDESGRWILPNGNYLVDVHYHFCILMSPRGPRHVVLGLSSTQLKPSREWMTAMAHWRINGKPAPMMALITRLTTVDKSNEKGKWKLLRPEIVRVVNRDDPSEVALYIMAKEFHAQVVSGKAKVDEEAVSSQIGDEEVPF